MMRWLIESSLRLRFVVVLLALVLLAVGITQARTMPVDVFPEFNPPYVEVQTEALGLSAEEVEQMITVPMEQDLLNGVPWLREIRSESIPGLSSIQLTFDENTDLIRARQMVTERLSQAFALPHVSKPPTMLQPLSANNRVMMVGLSSKTLSLIEMSVLARWTIGPRLMGVPGVANVSIWGNRDRQLQVQVDPKVLQEKKVSLLQVLETTGNAMWVSSLSFLEASTPGTAGFVDTPNQRLGIRHILPISSPEGLSQVPIDEKSELKLGDVATVVEDHQPLIGDAITNDTPNLMLVIEKLPESNTMEVTEGIESALEALRPGLPGLDLDSSIFRPANYIEMTIGNLRLSLLLGAALLLLALLVFFFTWRTVLIALVVIPVSLATALICLAWRGESLNLILLAGLAVALGVLIDDVVIDVENIATRLRQARAQGSHLSTTHIIFEAAFEMRSALAFATIVILLPLCTLFFIQGRPNAFLSPFVYAYGAAILASLLMALGLTPALALLLMAKDNQPVETGVRLGRASPLVAGLQGIYGAILSPILRVPRLALVISLIALLVGAALLPMLRLSLLPTFHEPNLMIHLEGATGTSEAETSRIVARLSTDLRKIPGILNVGANIGRAIMSDRVVNVNSSDVWVEIDPSADYKATVAAVGETVNGYPGFKHSVQTYLNDRTHDALTGLNEPIGVRIFGENRSLLLKTAEEVQKAIAGVAGISAAHVVAQPEEPTLEVTVDMAAAQKVGIKPGDVRRAATTLISGLQVGSLFEESKVFDVVVLGTPATRHSLSALHDLLIDTPDGGTVRLGDVAKVNIQPVPSSIKHIGVFNYADVALTTNGRDPSSIAADIKAILPQVKFPIEFHAEVIGTYSEQRTMQNRLLSFILALLIGIYLLVQAANNGWRLSTAFFLSLPLALVGGLLAAYLSGGVLSLGSVFGLITLFAITTRNGLVLINHYQSLHVHQLERGGLSQESLLRGAKERMGPTLTTAVATALALLPLVIAGNGAGYEIVRPMAIVILGGLVTSTLFNLFVTPASYARYGVRPEADPLLMTAHVEPSLEMAAD